MILLAEVIPLETPSAHPWFRESWARRRSVVTKYEAVGAVAVVVVPVVSERATPLKLMAFPGVNIPTVMSAQKLVPVSVSEKSAAAPALRADGLIVLIAGDAAFATPARNIAVAGSACRMACRLSLR